MPPAEASSLFASRQVRDTPVCRQRPVEPVGLRRAHGRAAYAANAARRHRTPVAHCLWV